MHRLYRPSFDRAHRVLVLLTAVAVHADGITVMSSGAMSRRARELMPAFERASGSTLTVVSGGSVAGAADSIPDRLQRGERADVVIMAAAGIDDLAKAGHSSPAAASISHVPSIGLAVRAGAPKPDIGSVDALRRALLAAKSVAYSASVSGVDISTELFQRLGIAAEMARRAARWTANRLARSSRAARRSWDFSRSANCARFPVSRWSDRCPQTCSVSRLFGGRRRAIRQPDRRTRADRVPVVAGRRRRDREERDGASSPDESLAVSHS